MPGVAPQGSTTLHYDGKEHGCTTAHGQCYWNELTRAQSECSKWPDCKFLYESDKHSPATPEHPIFWARGDGESIHEDGATLWKEQGGEMINCNVAYINIILRFESIFFVYSNVHIPSFSMS